MIKKVVSKNLCLGKDFYYHYKVFQINRHLPIVDINCSSSEDNIYI